ncbi:hypothetical protein [Tsukamurella strandjordii]|uniref:hypothetical protein n=1 Tax=Tsukamurella strandjordii TaxID=147577 RepID=UPI0031E27E88
MRRPGFAAMRRRCALAVMMVAFTTTGCASTGSVAPDRTVAGGALPEVGVTLVRGAATADPGDVAEYAAAKAQRKADLATCESMRSVYEVRVAAHDRATAFTRAGPYTWAGVDPYLIQEEAATERERTTLPAASAAAQTPDLKHEISAYTNALTAYLAEYRSMRSMASVEATTSVNDTYHTMTEALNRVIRICDEMAKG